MESLSFVSLDLETTGFSEKDEIIEIGLIKVLDGKIIDKFQSLVKPIHKISKNIEALTGISNEMVKDRLTWHEIEEEVIKFIEDSYIIAHNVSFDRGFLERSLSVPILNTWVDTYDLAKIAYPTLQSYKLSEIANHLSLVSEGYHRALNDAEIAAKIFLKIIEKLTSMSPFLIEEDLNILKDEENGLSLALKYVQKKALANFSFENKISFEQDREEKETLNLNEEGEEILKPGGIISKHSNSYEYRPDQIKMLKTVSEAFEEEKHAVIEAGTGIGKSMAYLIPALLWSEKNEKKVIIATHTIALQEQLFKKEIPFLEKCFNGKLPVALVKGRTNYLCKRRFEKLKKNSKNISWPEKVFLLQTNHWDKDTKTGDKEELNLKKLDNEFWYHISSQSETCLGRKCPYYFHGCFFIKNKRSSEKSKIIITNHALLLQDAKINNKLLPEHENVIIDEAHNLEDEATEQFASRADLLQINKICNQLSKGKNNGILEKINQVIKDRNDWGNLELLKDNILKAKEDIISLQAKIERLRKDFNFKDLISSIEEIRITEKERNLSEWSYLFDNLQEVKNYLLSLKSKLIKIISWIEVIDALEEMSKEVDFIEKIITEVIDVFTDFLKGEDESKVYWVSVNNSYYKKNIILNISPIEVGYLLEKNLFSVKKSVVLTSATLSVANSFKYTIKELGLDKHDFLWFNAQSPFNFKEQSLIAIPSDLPDPVISSEIEYTDAIIKNIKKISKVVYGGILVLFTSYRMLDNVYNIIKNDKDLVDRMILAHGKDGSRTNIINTLKNNKNSIVLGVNSFWEGIDVKGVSLTTVIIVKLPFTPPTRPVIAARLERLQQKGEKSFFTYSLPRAILKFRQGYGRLIRGNNDWGSLIILDKRVITKRYGEQFLKSLPEQEIVKGTSDKICNILNNWSKNKINFH